MLQEKINIQKISDSKENLNKENFWNTCNNDCPKTMKLFCRWIDFYKSCVDWYLLFNGNLTLAGCHSETNAPKFHDIPFEMQFGIILAFFAEKTNVNIRFQNVLDRPIVLTMICDLFEQCELHFDRFVNQEIIGLLQNEDTGNAAFLLLDKPTYPLG